MTTLLGTTVARIIAAIDALAVHADLFRSAVPKLTAATAPTTSDRALRVVGDWLAPIVSEMTSRGDPIAGALEREGPGLAWRKAYEELPATTGLTAFRDHYSWAPLLGGVGAHEPSLASADVLVGLTLQAPGVDYPHHHHRAAELYGVLSGSVDWQVGRGPWRRRGPGDVVVHRRYESHSMRTDTEPVLCWVLWPSETDSAVVMPSLDPDPAYGPRTYD